MNLKTAIKKISPDFSDERIENAKKWFLMVQDLVNGGLASIEDCREVQKYFKEVTNRNFTMTSASNRKLLTARLNDGYSISDIKKVIDVKTKQWNNTDMQTYIRPATLFGNKFEGYLNECKCNTRNAIPSGEL